MNGKTVVFIPCCAQKYASGQLIPSSTTISKENIPLSWTKLQAGRLYMKYCIKESPLTAALYLYTGSPYSTFRGHLNAIIDHINLGVLKVFIISAGYGVVDACEPIHDYNAILQGDVAAQWRNTGLVNVIAEVISNEKPTVVLGYFAGTSDWSTSGSKYRYFFTEGVRQTINQGTQIQTAGCFYRMDGLGVKAILGALGNTLIDSIEHQFCESFVEDVEKNKKKFGNVTVGFDRISGHINPEVKNDYPLNKPVLFFSKQRTNAEGKTSAPCNLDFQKELDKILKQSEEEGKSFIDIKSGDLHRRVGGYPGQHHRMPICCSVMRKNMKNNDQILDEPLKGQGASLIIRFRLPR